jgi:hypothetical protein
MHCIVTYEVVHYGAITRRSFLFPVHSVPLSHLAVLNTGEHIQIMIQLYELDIPP